MSKKRIIIIACAAIALLTILLVSMTRKSGEEEITCQVKKGSIEVKVHTSGQLEAEKSENIVLPAVLSTQNVRVYEIKITDLIEEGSVVDSGQYIATLDHKVVEEVLTQARLELDLGILCRKIIGQQHQSDAKCRDDADKDAETDGDGFHVVLAPGKTMDHPAGWPDYPSLRL